MLHWSESPVEVKSGMVAIAGEWFLCKMSKLIVVVVVVVVSDDIANPVYFHIILESCNKSDLSSYSPSPLFRMHCSYSHDKLSKAFVHDSNVL